MLLIIFHHLNHIFFLYDLAYLLHFLLMIYWKCWLKVKDETINLNVDLELLLHLIFQEVSWLHIELAFGHDFIFLQNC